VKLNQAIAIEKGKKTEAHNAVTGAYQDVQKTALLSGISRVYKPKDEDGDRLPPERTNVILTASQAIRKVRTALGDLFEATGTKEWGNTMARADVEVDGVTLMAQVPVTYLLFLEKQLVNIGTFVRKLPTLDPAEEWDWDENAAVYRTKATETNRSKKVPKVLVKAAATDKHPAQTDVYMEDINVGTWETVKFSGALPKTVADNMSARVDKLTEAVKVAREAANMQEVRTAVDYGAEVLNYIFVG
jgi:hypothetical protein